MGTTPKVSVIIPIYNSRQYLSACLDSAVASISERTAEVEIILVDDGSTDGCSEICDCYVQKYPFIRCIHQKNAGVSAARNAGLAQAEGDYIAWIDSDDTVSADWFSEIFDVIVREAPDVIVFDSLRLEAGQRIPEQYGRPGGSIGKETLFDDIARDIRMLSGLPNKVMKADCYRGIRFGTETILEDYSRIFSILEPAETFVYLPRFLYFYRQQASSIVHSSTPEQSFFCVNAALRRKDALYPAHQTAATTGVAVQIVRFCRTRAYDPRYRAFREEYRYCVKYIRQNLWTLLRDTETPVRWKLKFVLLSVGLLPAVVKVTELRRREK